MSPGLPEASPRKSSRAACQPRSPPGNPPRNRRRRSRSPSRARRRQRRMSAPVVVSVDPGNSETDVVLGQALILTFDQVIDPTTLNDSPFSLTYPAPIQVVNSAQLISGKPESSTVSVDGTWSFATVAGATVATFQPSRGFQQN